jgi:hypothetical protein
MRMFSTLHQLGLMAQRVLGHLEQFEDYRTNA